jgi:hypothetical protein
MALVDTHIDHVLRNLRQPMVGAELLRGHGGLAFHVERDLVGAEEQLDDAQDGAGEIVGAGGVVRVGRCRREGLPEPVALRPRIPIRVTFMDRGGRPKVRFGAVSSISEDEGGSAE